MAWFKQLRQPTGTIIAFIIKQFSSSSTADLQQWRKADDTIGLRVKPGGVLEVISGFEIVVPASELFDISVLDRANAVLRVWNPSAGLLHFQSRSSSFDIPGSNYTNGNTMEPLRIRGYKPSASAPTTGTWRAGDVLMDSNKTWWRCTVAGTPGTWV